MIVCGVAGKPKGGKRPGAGAPPTPPKLPPDQLAEILVDNVLTGKTVKNLRGQTELSEYAAVGMAMVGRQTFAEYQEVFREKAQGLVVRATEMLQEKLAAGEGSIGQLTMLAGVFQDKLGAQKSGPQSVHLHLHGKDRETVLKQVMGRDTERSIDSSTETQSQGKAGAPVIDLVPAPETTPTIGAKDA
jgi:hypothetical protein